MSAEPRVLVLADPVSPRAGFIIGHLLGTMLGWKVELTGRFDDFRAWQGPRLAYTDEPVQAEVRVRPHGLLHETGIRRVPVSMAREGDGSRLLLEGAPFDPFAAAFLLLSLMEEYDPVRVDVHGRLPGADRIVSRAGLNMEPVVDHWALELAAQLGRHWPGMSHPQRRYRHIVTMDADNGLRYLGRPWWRQLAAYVRDATGADRAAARERLQVLRGEVADPFDIYADFMDRCTTHADRGIVFFLMKGNGAHDHASSCHHPLLRERMRSVAIRTEAGIHPSYDSIALPGLALKERRQLESIIGKPITASRQHFLRRRLPGTLRDLEREGIIEEHSTGFSDMVGFAAGTCTPFPWYDLQQECATGMVLVPFAAMDSAMHDRSHWHAEACEAAFRAVIERVRAVSGTLVTVWHDRFLSGVGSWSHWPGIFERTLQAAMP